VGLSAGPAVAGQTTAFTATVTNNGPSDAAGVVVTYTIPASTTFQSIAIPSGWSCGTPAVGGTGPITCTVSILATSATATLPLTLGVAASLSDGTPLTTTVQVASATDDPNLANNTASTATTVGASADLAVGLSAGPAVAGQSTTVTATVSNNGPSDAGGVSLGYTLPPGTTFQAIGAPSDWACSTPAAGGTGPITCTVPILAAGAAATLPLTLGVPANTPAGATLPVAASVSGAAADPFPANNAATLSLTVNTLADLAVTLGAGPAVAGQTTALTATVSNNGPSDAAGVVVTYTLPLSTTFQSIGTPAGWSCATPAVGGTGPITCTVSILAATATATLPLTIGVPSGVANGTVLTATAQVGSATADLFPANNAASAATTVGATADLAVGLSAGPAVAGQSTTVTATVSNNGPSDATGVSLSYTVAPGTTFQAIAAPAGWSCSTPAVGDTGPITCTVSILGASAAATLPLTLGVPANTPAGTTLPMAASVSAATADPFPANNTATVSLTVATLSDLAVSLSASPATAGQSTTVTATVSNNGPSDASGVVVTYTIPASTTFQSIAIPSGWSCGTPAVGGTGPITCTVAALAASAAATLPLTLGVAASLSDGTDLTTTVQVGSATADPDLSSNAASATAIVGASADLTLGLSAGSAVAGQTASVSANLANNGPSDAAGISLSYTLPSGTTFQSVAAPTGWSCSTPPVGSTGSVTCTTASLSAGATAPIVVTIGVPSSMPAGTTLPESASVSSTTADPNPGNNAASATTTVSASADLAATASAGPAVAGQFTTFTATVTDNGPSDAAGVSLSYTLPSGTTFQAVAAPAGWSCSTPPVGGAGSVTCTAATLPSGASASLLVTIGVPSGTPAGATLPESASVNSATADPFPANNAASVSVTVSTLADLALSTSTALQPVVAGQTTTLTATLTDNGPSDASGVSLSYTVPTSTTFQSASAPAGWSCTTPPVGGTGTVTCTTATLALGATVSVQVAIGLPTKTPAGTTFTATAHVTSATADPNPANNTATVPVVLSGAHGSLSGHHMVIRGVEPTGSNSVVHDRLLILTAPGALVTTTATISGTPSSLGSGISSGQLIFSNVSIADSQGSVHVSLPVSSTLLVPGKGARVLLSVRASAGSGAISYRTSFAIREAGLRLLLQPKSTTRGSGRPLFSLGHASGGSTVFSLLAIAAPGARISATVTFGSLNLTASGTAGSGGRVTLKFVVPNRVAPASGHATATATVTSSFRGATITRSIHVPYGSA
jgi:uncharacterized repeat protein (TIGR01451 family)